jgi:hypothetical protein
MMKRNFMKTILLFAALSIFSSLFHCVQGQKQLQGIDSLSFEVILTEEMLSNSELKGKFINSMDITPERLILLSTPDQYYLLGWGGMIPLGKRMTREIQSFAYTPDGLLMTVRGNELCSFDSLGNLSAMLRLPRQGMGISAGQDVMYLFDRNPGQKLYPIYVLARGAKYLKLLETPAPITSVAETDDAVLFASGASLYSVNPSTKELKLLFTEGNDKTILSVTNDRTNDIAYFSTSDEVFAIKGSDLGVISEKAGGILKYFNGLIVFDPATKLMIRILDLEEALARKPQTVTGPTSQQVPATPATPAISSPQAPATPATPEKSSGDIGTVKVLTNASVVDLVSNELSDNIIINIIRRAEVDFNLTTDAVIDLSVKGVSPEVIMEMRQAMKRQASEQQK